MGLSGISPGSLILILVIIVLLFGTKKLREVGNDLGMALKGLRRNLENPDEPAAVPPAVSVAHACQQHHEHAQAQNHTHSGSCAHHGHEHHHDHDDPADVQVQQGPAHGHAQGHHHHPHAGPCRHHHGH